MSVEINSLPCYEYANGTDQLVRTAKILATTKWEAHMAEELVFHVRRANSSRTNLEMSFCINAEDLKEVAPALLSAIRKKLEIRDLMLRAEILGIEEVKEILDELCKANNQQADTEQQV